MNLAGTADITWAAEQENCDKGAATGLLNCPDAKHEQARQFVATFNQIKGKDIGGEKFDTLDQFARFIQYTAKDMLAQREET